MNTAKIILGFFFIIVRVMEKSGGSQLRQSTRLKGKQHSITPSKLIPDPEASHPTTPFLPIPPPPPPPPSKDRKRKSVKKNQMPIVPTRTEGR